MKRETVERLRVALGTTSRYLRSTEAGEGLTPTELSDAADEHSLVTVEATAAGRALHERIREQRRASLAAHLDELPEDDVHALLAALPALEALAEGLRRDAPGPSAGLRT